MSTYSTNLALELIATGDQSGTWGNTTNTNLGTLIEQAISGYVTYSCSGGTDTITIPAGASGTARNMYIELTGTGGGTVLVPSNKKLYFFYNNTASAITVKVSGQTGVSIPAGIKTVVVSNGTDIVAALNSFGSTLTVPYGGTGATTLTGVLKGNGASAFTAATAGTDYLAPPSGTAILKANSGGALANATAGTDYVAPGTATTFTAQQTFSGTSSNLATKIINTAEAVTVSATAATGTINFDVTTQSVLYYTSNSSANWTMNFRASSGTSLNTALGTGESVTVVFMATNGSTAYYASAFQIDGSSVTPKWIFGSSPTSGNASSIDAYTFTIIKTASATYTVLASQIKYA
jgi:hypothetical protein